MNRRGFLRGVGGLGALAALAPFLPVSQASAALPVGASASRILFVTFPDGLEQGWFTQGDAPFSDVLASLEPIRHKLLVLGGLQGSLQSQLEAHAQGPASLWTGSMVSGGGDDAVVTLPSIDQVLADVISEGTAFRSLHFGTRSDIYESFGGVGYMHHLGPNQPIPPQDDPTAMFTTMFGASASGDDSEALARARAENKSVLDFVTQRIKRIQPQVAAQDRVRLEAHLDGVRQLERSLDALATLTCPTDAAPPSISGIDQAHAFDQFPEVVDVQTDLAILALQCGMTRVATLQLSNTGGGIKIPGVNEQSPLHEVMHNRPKTERVRINTWFMERFSSVLQKLDAVDLGNGVTLLDETLVVCSTEMGTGNHRNDPHPFFLAGGDGSYVELGRPIGLEGLPRQTRVLTSIVQAMGLRDVAHVGDFDDVQSFGPLLEVRG